MSLKQEMLDFIKQPIPADLGIVPQSIPVVFFGNIDQAKAATMSINPSSKEFRQGDCILQLGKKRFVDRDELGVPDERPLSDGQAERVYQSLVRYFQTHPYDDWFDQLENLFPDHLSYHDGSLIHMNITPWASVQAWSNLSGKQQTGLTDAGCLPNGGSWVEKVVQEKQIGNLFINAKSACDFLRQHGVAIREQQCRLGTHDYTIYEGTLGACNILGWPYLQNADFTDEYTKALQALILSKL